MKRWLPAPLLSAGLFVLWLLLNQSLGAGQVLLGVAVAIAMPVLMAPLRPAAGQTLFVLLILSGLLAATALVRVGIRHFWAPQDRPAPRLRVIECVPVALLLAACVMLVLRGEPALAYARATAQALHRPQTYIEAVLAARPVGRAPTARERSAP